MNAIRSRKESLRVAPAKGPLPVSVPHTAKHDRMNAAVAVSRGPQRSAAVSSGTMVRMLNALRVTVCSISGLKATRPTAIAPSWTAVDSRNRSKSNGRYRLVVHRTITGVTTSAPATFPSHQVNTMAGNCPSSADRASTRLPTPRIALIIVPGARQSRANFATALGVSNVRARPDQIVMSCPVTTASSVLPMAMPREVKSWPSRPALAISFVAFAVNDAAKMAGQTRTPRRRMAAKARPAAGQTGVALGWIDASNRPALASRKYAAPIARSSAQYFASPRGPDVTTGSRSRSGSDVTGSPKAH